MCTDVPCHLIANINITPCVCAVPVLIATARGTVSGEWIFYIPFDCLLATWFAYSIIRLSELEFYLSLSSYSQSKDHTIRKKIFFALSVYYYWWFFFSNFSALSFDLNRNIWYVCVVICCSLMWFSEWKRALSLSLSLAEIYSKYKPNNINTHRQKHVHDRPLFVLRHKR